MKDRLFKLPRRVWVRGGNGMWYSRRLSQQDYRRRVELQGKFDIYEPVAVIPIIHRQVRVENKVLSTFNLDLHSSSIDLDRPGGECITCSHSECVCSEGWGQVWCE